MRSSLCIAALGILGQTLAHFQESAKNCSLETVVPSKDLTWCPCYNSFSCAKLQVPLDYHEPALGSAYVPLVKYPAQANSTAGLYRGMILLNPGGPGESGVEEAIGYATTLQAAIGSNYDIVGFDPRGIYASEPVANCSVKPSNKTDLRSRDTPRMPDDYYKSWINYGIELGRSCSEEVGGRMDAGPHMSTATTARDMLSIVDAFAATREGKKAAKPANLLNYYGISYGTFLGQTFASMFPDRVGSVVLDGVVSPVGYLSNYTWSSVTHLDGVISVFFIQCYEAGLEGCSFYTGDSPKDIQTRFQKIFDQLDAEKAIVHDWANAVEVESALLLFKIALLTLANHPIENFGLIPDVLVKLESALKAKTLSAWNTEAMKIYGDPAVSGAVDVAYSAGVLCSDMQNRWYGKTLDDLRPLLADLSDASVVGDIWIKSMLPCLGWSIEATETFQGPFGGDTANPILFVGNTFDPVTSYDNAVNSAPHYKDAQALVVDGMGHTTMATQNLCALAHIGAYFQAGIMPGLDARCAFEGKNLNLTVVGSLEDTIAYYGLTKLVS